MDFLKTGITSREEVLLHLGLPDRANEKDSKFVYQWTTAWDLCFAAYGAGSCSEHRKEFALLIEFDNNGIVSLFEEVNGDQMMNLEHSDLSDSESDNWPTCDSIPSCEFERNLTDSYLYTNNEFGFSIQFPRKWEITCGKDPVIVKARVAIDRGFWPPRFPSSYLEVRVGVHSISEPANVLGLDRSLLLQLPDCCPENWTCTWEINVLESEEIVLDGMYAISEVHQKKGFLRTGRPYELYRLGAKRFGGQYEFAEGLGYAQLLTYWFARGDTLFEVTGEIIPFCFIFPVCVGKEKPEEAAKVFGRHKKVLENTIRSFHLIN